MDNLTTMPPIDTQLHIIIRDIEDISEMRAVEDLQKEIWGCTDREVFPSIALIPLREVGAVLIGAFVGDEMIGFVFGFPGIEEGRAILHSDMLAVKREYRSQGLGYKLKLAQRERALAKGIDAITWTFDPLQSLNAHLNFSRLGVIADRYKVNFYGQTTSFLHRTGTDRLWVTWLLNSERVKERVERGPARAVFSSELERMPALVQVGETEEPIIRDNLPSESGAIIEIPRDINALPADDGELAARWREATRHAFTMAINAGYVVKEFYLAGRSKQTPGVYHLSRTS
jgi:predicted GNAT superfamily acetyltransferase